MGTAVMLGQDLTEAAGLVRHGALAELAARSLAVPPCRARHRESFGPAGGVSAARVTGSDW
jgi:hypothetical protein